MNHHLNNGFNLAALKVNTSVKWKITRLNMRQHNLLFERTFWNQYEINHFNFLNTETTFVCF